MDSFILYSSQYSSIQSLSKTDMGELLDALYRYALSDGQQLPKFTHPQTEMAFRFISSRIAENNSKYLAICEKRRIAGRKGGRPKKNAEAADITKQKKTNKPNGFRETKAKQKKLTDTDTESRSISTSPDTSSDTLSKVADESATLQQKQKNKNARDDKKTENDKTSVAQKWDQWYEAVMLIFNDAVHSYGSSIRPVRALSDSRRAALRLLYQKYSYTSEQFRQAFANAALSNYCNGRTADRHRPVDFDFIIRENNFNRAYEGSL